MTQWMKTGEKLGFSADVVDVVLLIFLEGFCSALSCADNVARHLPDFTS